jgi:hypothetical protein
MVHTHVPLDIPPFEDLHAIEADRKTIARRSFHDFDVLVLLYR